MPKLTFTKQSISPCIYYARLEGYVRLFAHIKKAKGDAGYTVEIDGFVSSQHAATLAEAKQIVKDCIPK